MLVLSGCRGCLGFLQGTCDIPVGPFSLQISVIKILSGATFIPKYPQKLCKTAHKVSIAVYHLVTWLHQTGGGNLFPCEMWSHKNPWDGRHCNAPCVALLPPTEAGDLAQLCCSLSLIKRVFHKWKCKCRKLGSATLSLSHCTVWEIWRSKFLIRNGGQRNSFQVSQQQSCKITCVVQRGLSISRTPVCFVANLIPIADLRDDYFKKPPSPTCSKPALC